MSEESSLQGSIITTWSLVVITVCLRYHARRSSKAGFWYDDWFIIPATVSIPNTHRPRNHLGSLNRCSAHVCISSSPQLYSSSVLFGVSHPYSAVNLLMIGYDLTSDSNTTVETDGVLQDEYFLNLYQLEIFMKAQFVCEICWTVVIWTVKYSILSSYWRLFSANRRSTRVIIWILAALVTCWGIVVVRSRPSLLGKGKSALIFQ